MAKFRLNKMVESATGKVGNMVFKQVGKTTLFTQAPQATGEISEKQRAHRDRFRRAIAYAKTSMLDPVLKAAYEKSVAGQDFMTAFTAAVTDYMNAPKIDSIDTIAYTGKVGESIIAQVFDTFKVVSAIVTITLANGTVVETGAAALIPGSVNWQYVTTQVNTTFAGSKVKVVIRDTAGNSNTVEKTL